MNLGSLRKHCADIAELVILRKGALSGQSDAYQFKGRPLLMCQWQPDTNIEQAMMLLEKFDDWELGRTRRGITPYCRIFANQMQILGAARENTVPLAITLACAKATGWKDE